MLFRSTNRQLAVKDIAATADVVVVIGSKNSSNSNRLVEVARIYGAKEAFLVDRADELPWEKFTGIKTLGLTAGASAPESLVEETIAAARQHFDVTVQTTTVADENMTFKIPRILVA